MLGVQICIMRPGDLLLEMGRRDVGEGELQCHPISPPALCHLLAANLRSYLISVNFSFFSSNDKSAHQAAGD